MVQQGVYDRRQRSGGAEAAPAPRRQAPPSRRSLPADPVDGRRSPEAAVGVQSVARVQAAGQTKPDRLLGAGEMRAGRVVGRRLEGCRGNGSSLAFHAVR